MHTLSIDNVSNTHSSIVYETIGNRTGIHIVMECVLGASVYYV